MRPKNPICPLCGQRMKSADPTRADKVRAFLTGRSRDGGVVKTTSHEISAHTGIKPEEVCTVLRKFEADEVIVWQRGKPGGGRGAIKLL